MLRKPCLQASGVGEAVGVPVNVDGVDELPDQLKLAGGDVRAGWRWGLEVSAHYFEFLKPVYGRLPVTKSRWCNRLT